MGAPNPWRCFCPMRDSATITHGEAILVARRNVSRDRRWRWAGDSGDRSWAEPKLREQGMVTIAKLPGREVVRRLIRNRATLKQDAIAGLTGAIGSVPDGIASGVLAGVNPIYGLYASMIGPIVGGISASAQLMMVTTTSAAAIAAGQSLGGLDGEDRIASLFLLTQMIGAFQVAAGLLRLGSLTRFVSHSVMTGFLTGIAILIVFGQLGDFTGYAPEGANKITQTFDLLRHLD